MSDLSEKLKQLMDSRGFTVASMARMCHIDRSTFHQYLTGRRPIRNLAQLENLLEPLSLSIPERDDIIETFDMEQIGLNLYRRRQAVAHFISSLPYLALDPVVSLPEKFTEHIVPVTNSQVLYSELELYRVLLSSIKTAAASGSVVRMMLSPHSSARLTDLLLAGSFPQLQLVHILCLSNNWHNESHHMDDMLSILRCCSSLPGYRPCYFYGNENERFGAPQMMPNVLVTDEIAIQFSVDEKKALVHTAPAAVQLFQDLLVQQEHLCRPIMSYHPDILSDPNWSNLFLSQADYHDSFVMANGICSLHFWTRDFITRNINPQLPEKEAVIELYSVYCANLLQLRKQQNFTLLTTKANLRYFMTTGIFREYPTYFFRGPLDKEDRRLLLNHFLKSVEEGWQTFHLVDESRYPLNPAWEMMCPCETQALLQHVSDVTFNVLLFSEPGISRTIYDYMQSLSESRYAMSCADSVALLRRWMDELL